MKVQRLEKIGREVVHFEKKKLVLPVLMVLSLVWLVSALHHADSVYAEEQTDLVVEQMGDLSQIVLAGGLYGNNSLNVSERQQYYQEQEDAFQTEIRSDPWFLPAHALEPVVSAAPIAVYEGQIPYWLYPFFPGKPQGVFSQQQGYYLFDELPKSLVLMTYQGKEIEQLAQEVKENRTNLTLKEFTDRAAEIRNRSIDDPRVRSYAANAAENRSSHGFEITGGVLSSQWAASNVAEGNVKQIQWYHFIPSILATFLWWYLISGVLIVGSRRMYGRYESSLDRYFEIETFRHGDISIPIIAWAILSMMVFVEGMPLLSWIIESGGRSLSFNPWWFWEGGTLLLFSVVVMSAVVAVKHDHGEFSRLRVVAWWSASVAIILLQAIIVNFLDVHVVTVPELVHELGAVALLVGTYLVIYRQYGRKPTTRKEQKSRQEERKEVGDAFTR